MTQHQVNIISTSTITIESTAEIALTPSDLELLFLEYMEMGLLFFNPTPPQQTTLLAKSHSASIIHHLKQSFHRTLHFFPTLAGRLATKKSHDGAATCFFLDCSHEDGGVLFIHASAKATGLTVSDVNESSNSGPGVVPSLFALPGICNIDGASHPLLALQVTELVDGLFVGWTLNQLVADGTAFWHFLKSWAEISRGGESISKLPILNRDQVNLDLVGTKEIYIRDEHLMIPHPNTQSPARKLSERVFCLTKERVGKLKAKANEETAEFSNGKKISSLQAAIAHVWRSIIRCRFNTTKNNNNTSETTTTTFEIPMGARQRMSPPLPDEYFGNAIFPGIVTLEAGKVVEKGLGWTAWQINRMVASAREMEKVKDFYKRWAKEPKFLKFDAIPTNHFILISSPRFDICRDDFGWGAPVAVRSGRACSFDGRITITTGVNEGSLDVEVCLLRETLDAMAEDMEFMEFVTLRGGSKLLSIGASKL